MYFGLMWESRKLQPQSSLCHKFVSLFLRRCKKYTYVSGIVGLRLPIAIFETSRKGHWNVTFIFHVFTLFLGVSTIWA